MAGLSASAASNEMRLKAKENAGGVFSSLDGSKRVAMSPLSPNLLESHVGSPGSFLVKASSLDPSGTQASRTADLEAQVAKLTRQLEKECQERSQMGEFQAAEIEAAFEAEVYLTARCKALEADNRELAAKLDAKEESTSTIETLQVRIAGSEREVKMQTERASELEDELEVAKGSVVDLLGQQETLQRSLAREQAAGEVFHVQLPELESTITNLREELESAKAWNAELEGRLVNDSSNWIVRGEELSGRVHQLEDQLAEARGGREAALAAASEAQLALSRERRQVAVLLEEAAGLHDRVQELESGGKPGTTATRATQVGGGGSPCPSPGPGPEVREAWTGDEGGAVGGGGGAAGGGGLPESLVALLSVLRDVREVGRKLVDSMRRPGGEAGGTFGAQWPDVRDALESAAGLPGGADSAELWDIAAGVVEALTAAQREYTKLKHGQYASGRRLQTLQANLTKADAEVDVLDSQLTDVVDFLAELDHQLGRFKGVEGIVELQEVVRAKAKENSPDS